MLLLMPGTTPSVHSLPVYVTYYDWTQDFDSVWQQGLLFELKCMDNTNVMLKWVESYLDNRQQLGCNNKWF